MASWIIETITEWNYLGLFLLMLIESVFPPIPAELIVPFAGFVAAEGKLNVALVLLTTTAGAMAGMLPWYFLGRLVGLNRIKTLADRYGRWLTLNSEEIDRAVFWFIRFGPVIVFIGRLMPLIRTLISVPAGLAQMHLWQFLLASGLGALIWNSILIGAGFILADHYHTVETWIDPFTSAVLGLIVLFYIFRLVTWRPSRPAA